MEFPIRRYERSDGQWIEMNRRLYSRFREREVDVLNVRGELGEGGYRVHGQWERRRCGSRGGREDILWVR